MCQQTLLLCQFLWYTLFKFQSTNYSVTGSAVCVTRTNGHISSQVASI